MTISSGFSYWKCWFSTAILNYQRVIQITKSLQLIFFSAQVPVELPHRSTNLEVCRLHLSWNHMNWVVNSKYVQIPSPSVRFMIGFTTCSKKMSNSGFISTYFHCMDWTSPKLARSSWAWWKGKTWTFAKKPRISHANDNGQKSSGSKQTYGVEARNIRLTPKVHDESNMNQAKSL